MRKPTRIVFKLIKSEACKKRFSQFSRESYGIVQILDTEYRNIHRLLFFFFSKIIQLSLAALTVIITTNSSITNCAYASKLFASVLALTIIWRFILLLTSSSLLLLLLLLCLLLLLLTVFTLLLLLAVRLTFCRIVVTDVPPVLPSAFSSDARAVCPVGKAAEKAPLSAKSSWHVMFWSTGTAAQLFYKTRHTVIILIIML